jgi:uncharacterized protein YeeX (DUF496 family)
MFDIEKCHKNVFEIVAVSEIMNKLKIEENDAIKILDKMYKRIELFSKECISPKGYYSVRYAIMNRINRI